MAPPTGPDDATTRPLGEPADGVLLPVSEPSRLLAVVDLSIGAGTLAVSVAARAWGVAGVVTRPILGRVPRPPLVGRSRAPRAVIGALTRRGTRARVMAGTEVAVASRELVPAVTDAVLDRIDLTELVVSRVDFARVVEVVLDRIDLTALVLERVDLDEVIAAADLDAAAARLDVDAVAAARLDVDAVAARLDVDAVAARLDADAVAAQLDLVGIANYIVDAIDLPEIIRTSTGSVATEAVRGVRMQSIDADTQLQSVVDRALLRRRGRRTQAPDVPPADGGGEGS